MSPKLAVMKALIADWARGDVEAVLAHMSENIVWHYAAAVAPPLKGKAKARRFLETFGGQISEVRWRLFDHAEAGDRLFVEGVDEYVAKDGALIAAPYAAVLEFDGLLIRSWRDYVDVGVIEAQKAGQSRSAWLGDLIDRPAL